MSGLLRPLTENPLVKYSLYSWTNKKNSLQSSLHTSSIYASSLATYDNKTLPEAVFKPFYPAPTTDDYTEVIHNHLHAEKIESFLNTLRTPGKSLTELQSSFLDLQTADPVVFGNICEQVYLAYKDREKTGPDFGKNKILNNPLILLLLKNNENQNILEQFIHFYRTQEIRKADENLLSSLRSELSSILHCDLEKARETIKKIDAQRVFSLLSYRIWELDNPTKDESFSGWGYGERLILDNPFYLLNFKGVNLINEYLEQSKKAPIPQISVTKVPRTPPLPTDNIHVVKSYNLGMQVEELKEMLDSSASGPEVYKKISQFDYELHTFITNTVWATHYMPKEKVTFGEDILKTNPKILYSMLDSEGNHLIAQMQQHFKTKVELERSLIALKEFSRTVTSSTASKQSKIDTFNRLDPILRNSLQYQIWYRNGGHANNKFQWGNENYGRDQILNNPMVLLEKHSLDKHSLDTVISELEKMSRVELVDIQKSVEKSFTIPSAPNEAITIDRLTSSDPSTIKKVTLVTAEFEGICKEGGLAPAVYGMAEALTMRGQKVRVIMPKYSTLPQSVQDKLVLKTHYKENGMKKELKLDDCYGKGKIDNVYKLKFKGQSEEFKKIFKGFKGNSDNITFYFIEDTPETSSTTPSTNRFEGRAYSGGDDQVKERFGYFSSAAASLASTLNTDVIHTHDWHVAAVPKLVRMKGKNIPLVFTFHNNADQGVYWNSKHIKVLESMGLGNHARNLMVEAFYNAHQITTVSKTFAVEAQGKLLGKGIDSELRKVAYQGENGRLTGIVNGSNPSIHDTSTNNTLANWVHPLSVNGQLKVPLIFGPDDDIFKKKMEIAQQLQLAFLRDLDVAFDFQKPLVLFVGRYDLEQKGLEMLEHAMDTALANGAQVVFMGLESGREDDPAKPVLDRLQKKARDYGCGAYVARDLAFQQKYGALLRSIAALTLVPSKFEPCGLVQLEAMLYASAPFCRDTGGLHDTVTHLDNGFLYEAKPDPNSLEQIAVFKTELAKAIKHMIELYQKPEEANKFFKKLQRIGKASDWVNSPSGVAPIDQYRLVYAQAKKDATTKSNQLTLNAPFLKKPPELIKA